MICPYCGTENRNMAKFCDSCGQELPTVAPDAREMFADDVFLVEGNDAVTIDLQGLEHMVDSSNSGLMHDFSQDAFQGSTQDAFYMEDGMDEYSQTISLDAQTRVLSDPYAGISYDDEVYQDAIDSQIPYQNSHQGSPGDVYSTQTIPISTSKPYRTAEFSAVSPSGTSGSMDAVSAKVYSATSSDSFHDKTSSKSPKKKIVIGAVAAVVVLILALAAFLTYNMQLWGGVAVPDVVRQTEEAATKTLEEAGFWVEAEYVVSDDVEGVVISTNPSAGMRVDEGSRILLSVSIPRVIPEVVGLTQDDATKALNDSGYSDIEYVIQKSNEQEGTVVSVEPGEGVEATADMHVVLAIAQSFRVPSVEGMTRDAAVEALEAEGYTVKTASYITEDIQEGMAVSTDPVAGSVLPSGSEVVLNVAHNRSVELIDATKAYFNNTKQFSINKMNYELGEIKEVTYQGSDTCAYTITARPYETHTWSFGDAETRYGNYETITGTITFNADNSIKSSNPLISSPN